MAYRMTERDHWFINEFIHKPCGEAIEWLRTQPDPITAWNNCPFPHWMEWALFYTIEYILPKDSWLAYKRWWGLQSNMHQLRKKEVADRLTQNNYDIYYNEIDKLNKAFTALCCNYLRSHFACPIKEIK